MESLVQQIGDDREQHGEGDAADGEDARVRKVREQVDDQPAHESDGQKGEDETGHQLEGGAADQRADHEHDARNERGAAEHA